MLKKFSTILSIIIVINVCNFNFVSADSTVFSNETTLANNETTLANNQTTLANVVSTATTVDPELANNPSSSSDNTFSNNSSYLVKFFSTFYPSFNNTFIASIASNPSVLKLFLKLNSYVISNFSFRILCHILMEKLRVIGNHIVL